MNYMNPNDKAMLEKVKPGWWAKHNDTGPAQYEASHDRWCLVWLGWCNSDVRRPPYITATCPETGDADIELSAGDITAIHTPTDDPSMETAYLLGEPEEVTREEAENMVKPIWHWLLPDGQAIRHAVDVLPLEDIILMVETAYAIESPGGNVYRIRENAE